MTLKEFREETKDLPEETIICTSSMSGQPFEVSSIEHCEREQYYNEKDQSCIGSYIQL